MHFYQKDNFYKSKVTPHLACDFQVIASDKANPD